MEEKDSNNDASGKVRLLNTPESSSTNQAANLRNSMAKKTLNEDVEQHYVLYFYLFSVLGLVNNLGYVMVGSAAHNLADKFDHKSLMPLFNLCEIVFGSLVRFINSKYLINIRHSIRLTGNVIVMIVAYLLIAAITIHPIGASFYIALFCALLHGVTSSFGESTLLGFLKGFPSKQVGSFSSGTGMAGVCGSGIFLLLGAFMSDGFVFLAATPAILFYFMNVMITSKKKSTLPFVEENPQAQARAESIRRSMDSNNDLTNSADDNEITNEEDEGLEGIEMGEDAEQNLQMGFASFKLVLSKIGWYTLNLFLVYFLEYSVTVGFADAFSNKLQKYAEDNDDMNENSFFIKNVFTIFAFCYQFGVLISRSSLSLIKIKRVEIVTFLQILNFIFFFLNAQLFFLKNYFVMFGWMIFVGLMGGTSYVNVMYQILNSDKLKKTEKELAVITTCIFDDMGILLASLFSLTLSNTLFKHY